jgi:DNA-binding NarL/FixJ family response regulator
VDHHVGHILRKLDATNRTVAVLSAERMGIISAGM